MAGVDELRATIEAAVIATGYELFGYELRQQGQSQILRVYIDDIHSKITLDECAKISRQISAALDVADPFAGAYELEVSSPGMERPLLSLAHYQRYIGHLINFRLRAARDGRRRFSGRIISVNDNQINMQLDDEQSLVVAFTDIEKANLIAQF